MILLQRFTEERSVGSEREGALSLAGVGWGSYIRLTQHVGDRFTGITGLSITLPVAAIATAAVGIAQAAGHLTWIIMLAALGLGLLHPLITFALEMLALKRMTRPCSAP